MLVQFPGHETWTVSHTQAVAVLVELWHCLGLPPSARGFSSYQPSFYLLQFSLMWEHQQEIWHLLNVYHRASPALRAGNDAKGYQTHVHCWQGWRLEQLRWKAIWQFFKRLRKNWAYEPGSSMSRYAVKRTENKCPYVNSDLFQVFIEALLLIVKEWRKSNYLPSGEQITECAVLYNRLLLDHKKMKGWGWSFSVMSA